ncbi:MAG: DUF4856 domain-containing protein [Saprospiraceae bacterium]
MLHSFKKSLPILSLVLFLVACSEKDKAPLDIPNAYDGSSFSANVTTEDAIRSQLEALVAEAKKGRTAGVVLDYSTLSQLFNAYSPSLKTVSTSYYADRLDGAGNWLDEMAKASGTAYTPGIPTGQGGVLNGYLFDENGLEYEQLLEKGLFGAALYNHAVSLMKGSMTPATADQLVRIFGAHPDFPNTPTSANAANPDKFMANYAARRDNNDGTGLYFQMKNAFIKLQTALNAGDGYNQERDEALLALRQTWEKVNAGTMINYCHSVISTLSATNPTDAQKGSALHAYGECVGFIHGWRTIPQDYKIITDAEIDELLVLFNAPSGSVPTSYKFAIDPLNELPKLTQVISKLKAKYSFSDQEVEDFRNNWVAVQGR